MNNAPTLFDLLCHAEQTLDQTPILEDDMTMNPGSASSLSVMEICAGAGGQSFGLESAGFVHEVAVEIDRDAAATLRTNRPDWHVIEDDVRGFDARQFRGIDLFAGGVPCPPFSVAGKQLGADDDRDLFPEALRIVSEAKPTAVLLENVKGLASARFAPYRGAILGKLDELGYDADWKLIESASYGVPQLRPRFILVALRRKYFRNFSWGVHDGSVTTVGEALYPFMAHEGWEGAEAWARKANRVAPTLVGGSKKHGGADLGPTRARAAWAALGVDGRGIADSAPNASTPYDAVPRLTLEMAARVQGFDSSWKITGRKTSAYRQIGNAFPPPVAEAIGRQIRYALQGVGSRSGRGGTDALRGAVG